MSRRQFLAATGASGALLIRTPAPMWSIFRWAPSTKSSTRRSNTAGEADLGARPRPSDRETLGGSRCDRSHQRGDLHEGNL